MEVILLEKVRNLGGLGDKVKVTSGYGRNFLVPQGKAVYATKTNIEQFESRRAELEKAAASTLHAAAARKSELVELGVITILAKAGDEGKLFGSVGTRDIADAITSAGVAVAKSEIHLPSGVLRQTGLYEVEVELHSDLSALVKINITSANASYEDEE